MVPACFSVGVDYANFRIRESFFAMDSFVHAQLYTTHTPSALKIEGFFRTVIGDAQCERVEVLDVYSSYVHARDKFLRCSTGLRQLGNREVKLRTNFSSITWKIPVSSLVCTKSNNAAKSWSRLSNICKLTINMLEQVVVMMRSEQNF
jgi:hypothetical protein